ncbi:E3 binding domain-containing protein [Kutzneria sp. 744]|uniref:E3 binding domain-containing protein n=1 Tax=Kutzneria sp. (strain 744) TaxID=345341 RepID=UPI0003EECAC4|nr:E3 binding domain-containing protein [Kutzneria sp. 744]EWM18293.1 pyruvate dehydrogenase E2 component [Kutzneria sp. 744]
MLETDKAAVEAEASAVLLRRLVDGGSTVEAGAPIAVLGAVGEDVSSVLAELGGDAVAEQPQPKEPPQAADQPRAERIFAGPLARKLLKKAGIPRDQVGGTGPNGRIVRKDVAAAVAQGKIAAQPAAAVAPPRVATSPA